jgi:PAT family beta-lactamase induction signal transducer AmpG
MKESAALTRRAWLWVTAAYLFQSIPAAVRDEALPVALKNTGYADKDITQAVALLGLIFGFKIMLAPLVAAFRPRGFILSAQLGISLLLGALALQVAAEHPSSPAIIGCLVLLSFAAAAHDFALDGYFVSALDDRTRATHSGLLNFASKLGMVLAGPGLIWIAGHLMKAGPSGGTAWSWALGFAMLLALLATGADALAFRNEPAEASQGLTVRERFLEMKAGLLSLFADRRLPAVLGLIFFYRASEIHMARILPLFAISAERGGLGLGNETYAVMRIVTAVLGLAIGGVIGSQVVARLGLGRALITLGIVMHLPLIAVNWLATAGTHDLRVIGGVFFVEYLAYGAGLCALLLAMMKLASGPGAAVRYAALSTFALLANYLPGLWAGRLSDSLGYGGYFLFALCLSVPGVISTIIALRHFRDEA